MACFARSFQKISIGSMPKACCMAALIASTYLCLREGGRAFKEESPEAATPPFDTEKFLIGLACSLCMIPVTELAILITTYFCAVQRANSRPLFYTKRRFAD